MTDKPPPKVLLWPAFVWRASPNRNGLAHPEIWYQQFRESEAVGASSNIAVLTRRELAPGEAEEGLAALAARYPPPAGYKPSWPA